MLNYNKIHSAINFDRTSKRSLANFMGIGESTLRSRLEKENLTPNDVEKLSEFFEKPIAYWFDKEEVQVAKQPKKAIPDNETADPGIAYKRNDIEKRLLALEAKVAEFEEFQGMMGVYFETKERIERVEAMKAEKEKLISSKPEER